MVTADDIQEAKTLAGGTITRVETDPATGQKTFVSLSGVKVSGGQIVGGGSSQKQIVQGVGGRWVNGVWFPNDPQATDTIIVDPQSGRSKAVATSAENIGAIEAGRQKTLATRQASAPLTSAQTAVALEASQQQVKFSPKAEALRSSRLAETKQQIAEPTETKVFLAGGKIQATGTARPFLPDKTPSPRVDSTQKGRGKDQNIASLSPELSAEVRARQQSKEIQQTDPSFELADLRRFKKKPPAGTISAEPSFRPKTKLINTQVGALRAFGEDPKTFEGGGILRGGAEFTQQLGIAVQQDKKFFGSTVAGAGLIFLGTTSKTAFDVTLGIPQTFLREGPLGLLESYNPANVVQAIRQDKLLRSSTPGARAVELAGLGTGLVVGSTITGRTVKAGFKARSRSQLNKLLRKQEVSSRGVLRKGSKGQATFTKKTESGQTIKTFGEDIPPVKRVVVNRKVKTFDVGGKRLEVSKTKVKKFDPVKDALKKDLKDPFKEAGKAPGQSKLSSRLDPKPGKVKDISPIDKGTSQQQKLKTRPLDPGEFDVNLFDFDPRSSAFLAPAGGPIFQTFSNRFPFFGVVTVTKGGPGLISRSFSPPTGGKTIPTSKQPAYLLPPKIVLEEDQNINIITNTGIRTNFDISQETEPDQVIAPVIDIKTVQQPRSILDERQRLETEKDQILPPAIDVNIDQDPAQRQGQDPLLIPKIDVDVAQDLGQPQQLQDPRIPREPKQPRDPKLLKFPQDKEVIRGQDVPVYDVFAKEKRRFIKVNKKPLPRKKALNLGAEVVDNTASATFKIKKVGFAKRVDALSFNLKRKFAERNGLFIEKPGQRIDTRGELLGITVKGWIANKRRGF